MGCTTVERSSRSVTLIYVYEMGDIYKIPYMPLLGVSPLWVVTFISTTGFPAFHESWTVSYGQVPTIPMSAMVGIYLVTSADRFSVENLTMVSEYINFFQLARSSSQRYMRLPQIYPSICHRDVIVQE